MNASNSAPDHEAAILAAVLLAQRAGEMRPEDVSEATDRLAELAGQPDEEGDDEEGQADAGG